MAGTTETIEYGGNAVKQVYTIVNLVAKQVMGEQAITAIDTGSFVSMGKAVTSSKLYREAFLNAIPDVLAKTIVSSRSYLTGASHMIKYAFEYGTYIRKITVNMPEAETSKQWLIGEPDFKPEYAPVIKSDVRVRVFAGFTSWQMGVTIPDNALKTAFTSPVEMGAFISAIFIALENSMKMAIENLSDLTRANFIGWKLHGNKPCCVIDLLEGFNTASGRNLTRSQGLIDEDCLAWSTAQMINWSLRLTRMSTQFNEEGFQRHTPKEYQVCEILQDFESYVNTFLKRVSFQEKMVQLPNYTTVPYWQAPGLTYDWDDISSVNLTLSTGGDSTEEGSTGITIQQSGIVGVIYDIEALGITINEQDSESLRNPQAKYTDYWSDANFGFFNDISENGIVFIFGKDEEEEPENPENPENPDEPAA